MDRRPACTLGHVPHVDTGGCATASSISRDKGLARAGLRIALLYLRLRRRDLVGQRRRVGHNDARGSPLAMLRSSSSSTHR